MIIGQRLRKGAAGSPRGAARIVADALKTVTRLPGPNSAPVLLRADSAYYGHATVSAALKAGADVSITARQDPAVKRAIGTIADDAWTKIQYTNAIYDPDTHTWISVAEVAEVPFTAFSSRPKKDQIHGASGRQADPGAEQEEAVPADAVRHAPLSRVLHYQHPRYRHRRSGPPSPRDHRASQRRPEKLALAHLPSGIFTANAAWLVLAVIAFNLTRTAGVIADHAGRLAKATTATIRRTLITVPARLARSARRITLHLPEAWPWHTAFAQLFTATHAPPPAVAT